MKMIAWLIFATAAVALAYGLVTLLMWSVLAAVVLLSAYMAIRVLVLLVWTCRMARLRGGK